MTNEGADASEDGTGRGTPIVVQPLALRGGEGGAELEAGAPGAPYNALRAGGGGASEHSLIAIHENQRGEITTSETMGALKTGGGKPGQGYPAVSQETIVRRLTEMECERAYRATRTAGQTAKPRAPATASLATAWLCPASNGLHDA